jgi:acetoacetyl-CoA synthetase
MNEPIWSPSEDRIAATHLARFLAEVGSDVASVTDYDSFYRWSVDEPASFWAKVRDDCGLVTSEDAATVVEDFDRMPGARWFPGMRLNFAENLLRHRGDEPALVAWNESGRQQEMSYAALYAEVARVAAALHELGVGPHDRVAALMPNVPETLIAMLAATSLGAVFSSCSPDFGVHGILDRFGQIQPKVLFAADGYIFGGKRFDRLDRVREVAAAIPELERVVIIPCLGDSPQIELDLAVLWNDFTATDGAAPGSEIEFAQLPFDHPVYILYSSGTTGLPKCMVHGAGGTLLQHLKEHALHVDVRRGDPFFYFTTCGWMMWNWLVTGLASGATLVLYDGSPVAPRTSILFDIAQRERLAIFGVSAKYLALIEKEGLKPRESHDLTALRTILSTGSPLAPEGFNYVYRDVKEDVALASISGGTDIVSCFAGGNPIAPVYRGELQTRGLGMKVEVWDDEGRPVVGEKGELVCSQPFPSMPVGFGDDPEGEKYHQAYFDFFEGVWRHGDWAELNEHGGMVIHGRSDATLNPGGVRIGTAEIYAQVEQFDEVVEGLVVGQEWGDDTRIVLFVRLREDTSLDDELRRRIRERIRTNASPFHMPKKVVQVADIPRTRSGKITELSVRAVIHGRPVKNADALANPEALELFRDLPELQS